MDARSTIITAAVAVIMALSFAIGAEIAILALPISGIHIPSIVVISVDPQADAGGE
jgi:hypothetical protein